MGRTAPGRGGCVGQAPGLQARRVQDGQVSGAYLYPVFGGHQGGKHGLITAALSGPRSSSASPRPCLPQRMPWRSGGRAWVRERPHLSCPSGVCSGERREITAFGPFLQEVRLTHIRLPSLPAPALPLGANSARSHIPLLPPSLLSLFSLHLSILSLSSCLGHSLTHATLGALVVPGPWLVPLGSGQLTFFPDHSHENPGRLEGLPLAAEISAGEAIRFGGPRGLQKGRGLGLGWATVAR